MGRKTPIGATLDFLEMTVKIMSAVTHWQPMLNQNGVSAVVSAVSPYIDVRLAIHNDHTLQKSCRHPR